MVVGGERGEVLDVLRVVLSIVLIVAKVGDDRGERLGVREVGDKSESSDVELRLTLGAEGVLPRG